MSHREPSEMKCGYVQAGGDDENMEDTQGEVIFEPWAEETIELTSTPGICSHFSYSQLFSPFIQPSCLEYRVNIPISVCMMVGRLYSCISAYHVP